jgi:5'-deoxynucleotidase YfbR-like HD superfamily hydrolase
MVRKDWGQILDAASGEIRRLDYVWRFSSIPILVPENVSSHCFWAALYSALIHTEIYKKEDSDKLLGAIILKALMHDVGESISGDFVRTFKHSSEELKNAIDKAEETEFEKRIEQPIKNLVKLSYNLSEMNNNYVNAIVKAADFLCLYQFMRREWLRGNREIKSNFQMMIEDLVKMAKKQSKQEIEHANELSDLYYDMASSASEMSNYYSSSLTRERSK